MSVVYFVERDHWAPGASQIMRCRCGAHEDKLILEPGWRVVDVVDVVNKKEEFVHNFVLKGKNIEFWKCDVDVVDGMTFTIESDFEKQKYRIIIQTFKLSNRGVWKVNNKRESKIKERQNESFEELNFNFERKIEQTTNCEYFWVDGFRKKVYKMG